MPHSDYRERYPRCVQSQKVFNQSSDEVKADKLNPLRNLPGLDLPSGFGKMQCTSNSHLFLGNGTPGLPFKG